MTDLPYSLERNVLICAQRETVFRFFTDSRLFAEWWGAGSHIDGRPGGSLKIVYPNGVIASGQVLEAVPDERIVFTYGIRRSRKTDSSWRFARHDNAVRPARRHLAEPQT